MALTTLQVVALAALPLSFISITMGSVTHQNLPKELERIWLCGQIEDPALLSGGLHRQSLDCG